MAALVLNEEQQMLREAAQGFLSENAPISQLRTLRDTRAETGFSRDLWKGMVEMGFVGTLVDEDFGGSAFGNVGMGQVFEHAGRNLSASPLLSTAVLGVSAVQLAGSKTQQHELLPAIVEGHLLTALAVDETPRHAPNTVATTARRQGDLFVLDGQKSCVIDGHVADKLIVSVRTSGGPSDREGISLLLVDRDTAGVSVERTIMVDSRNAAIVRFDNVQVSADALLGELGQGFATLETVLDIANAQLAAELLGLSLQAFEVTVKYLQ